ncbi:MAG: bifunctional protein-serine/threonine kinase/phosphatase [Hyphomicrobiales bacterium]|nr:bifunctional protein-serine/threonine kinase/phosphatase [Hyphomicrobiales bacterium]
MARKLRLSIGQHSDKGRKRANQDFYGALVPGPDALGAKGAVIAIADGVSSSNVSHIAAESAIKALMTDYYCTSDAWSVKTSAQRVISATNSWLHGQTMRSDRRFDRDKGYICTLSAIIVQSTTAHIFHVGDSRIYRLVGGDLEQLTRDHRIVESAEESYLSRALGADSQVEIDYQAVGVSAGDIFILATDGVYDFIDERSTVQAIRENPGALDLAAASIVAQALNCGSDDNLTVQIVRIESTPAAGAGEMAQSAVDLPAPPLLRARDRFEGYTIVRELHASSRSHVYLASDASANELAVIKIPSVDLGEDADYRRRFLMEEWIMRRIDSAHTLKAWKADRPRRSLYVVTEYVEGQTLAQWMLDHSDADLETVRGIVEQIGKGLRAMHRLEMIHQDVRPANIMIDRNGAVKIIDFGATSVAGVPESAPGAGQILGTHQYAAPEYFIGDPGSTRSDIYSLGVIAYQMLSGRLPYGAQASRARSRAAQRKLRYRSVLSESRETPAFVDAAIRKAVHWDPRQRYAEVSEFLEDMRKPGPQFRLDRRQPLIERDPQLFWKVLSLGLALIVLMLLAARR